MDSVIGKRQEADSVSINVDGSIVPGPALGSRRLYLVWIMVVVTLLPWRSGDYYSGGVDPVVAAKGMLAVVALSIAFSRFLRVSSLVSLGVRTPLLISTYIVITWIGGWANGALVSSGILGIRVLITAGTVALLVLAYPVTEVLRTAVVAFAAIGAALALSGFGALATRGRLYGSILPANPNQIAMLMSPAILWIVWRMLRVPGRGRDVCALAIMVALIWLTGSRTTLVAIAVGVIIIVTQASRLPRGGFISLLAVVPGAFYVVAFTGVVAKYIFRDGTGNVTTLNSRTIAWQAVFQAPLDFWQQWFGGGLAVKTINVSGQYWESQVLDSSWVSAYSQAGLLGLIIMGIWALTSLISAMRAPREYRSVLTALVACILIQSVLENGLIDSSVLFVAVLLPALAVELVDRRTGSSALSLCGIGVLGQRRLSAGVVRGDLSTLGEIADRYERTP